MISYGISYGICCTRVYQRWLPYPRISSECWATLGMWPSAHRLEAWFLLGLGMDDFSNEYGECPGIPHIWRVYTPKLIGNLLGGLELPKWSSLLETRADILLMAHSTLGTTNVQQPAISNHIWVCLSEDVPNSYSGCYREMMDLIWFNSGVPSSQTKHVWWLPFCHI